MLIVNVKGGTGAGKRRVREGHRRWFCNCETDDGMKLNAAHVPECKDCGARRSK